MLQPQLVDCRDVRIATMSADALRSTPALYELLNMIFYDAAEEPRFLSVTRERNRLTLVANGERLSRIPGAELEPTDWAVLRVDDVMGVVGALASLTRPLADAKIPVFHLSTYDSEFVLVPRSQLDKALDCLPKPEGRSSTGDSAKAKAKAAKAAARAKAEAEALAQFELGDAKSDAAMALAAAQEKAASPAAADAVDAAAGEAEEPTHSHPLHVLVDHPATILRVDRASAQTHMGALLRLLFCPAPSDPEQAVVSLTEGPDNELSILAGAAPWWREHCEANRKGAPPRAPLTGGAAWHGPCSRLFSPPPPSPHPTRARSPTGVRAWRRAVGHRPGGDGADLHPRRRPQRDGRRRDDGVGARGVADLDPRHLDALGQRPGDRLHVRARHAGRRGHRRL